MLLKLERLFLGVRLGKGGSERNNVPLSFSLLLALFGNGIREGERKLLLQRIALLYGFFVFFFFTWKKRFPFYLHSRQQAAELAAELAGKGDWRVEGKWVLAGWRQEMPACQLQSPKGKGNVEREREKGRQRKDARHSKKGEARNRLLPL